MLLPVGGSIFYFAKKGTESCLRGSQFLFRAFLQYKNNKHFNPPATQYQGRLVHFCEPDIYILAYTLYFVNTKKN